MQAAVAARDDDPPGPGPVQHPVQLTRVSGGRDLDVGLRPQDPQRGLQRLLVGGARVAVGDDE